MDVTWCVSASDINPAWIPTVSIARPYSLLGLNSSNVLVLVNGKRRHNSAVVNLDSTAAYGTNPVDLDMISISAIDHIEVLRDGASAQYGSDAIAG